MKALRALCAEMDISRGVIQVYEKAGFVKAAAKNKYGYLLYDRKEERIRKIRFLQKTGFRLKEIRELMDAPPERIKPALEEKKSFCYEISVKKKLWWSTRRNILLNWRKNDMKKTLLLIIIVLIALGVFACGENDSKKTEDVTQKQTYEEEDTNYEEEQNAKEDQDAEEDQEVEQQKDNDGKDEPSGIDPQFKEAMDSYEAFIDEYITFMEKHQDSEDTLGMLEDYTGYMEKYQETMEDLDEIDEDDLTQEELELYTEVMLRINEKLTELSAA